MCEKDLVFGTLVSKRAEQTCKHAEAGKTDGPPSRKDRQASRQTDRQADRQTDRQTGRQTDRRTDRHTDRQRDRQTCENLLQSLQEKPEKAYTCIG